MNAALSRVSAVGILALVLSSIWLFGFEPTVRSYLEGRADVELAAQRLARFDRISESSNIQEADLRRAQLDFDLESLLIDAPSPAIASASLQDHVRSAIRGAGGEQRTVQVIPARNVGVFTQIGVRVTATVPMSRLTDFFFELDSSEPFITVDNVVVRATARRRRRGAGQVEDDPALSVNLHLFAYVDAETDD